MRALDGISRALLFAACALHHPRRSATLAELAAGSGVSLGAARRRVGYLARAGHLLAVRPRRVAYRNRPVAEYAPVARGACRC